MTKFFKKHSYPVAYVVSHKTRHDEFFNHRKKVLYESLLSALFLQHVTLFMPVIKKVSSFIIPDIRKLASEAGQEENSLSTKMHHYFISNSDLKLLFSSSNLSDALFYEEICRSLNSIQAEDFYKQMCVLFTYITFFSSGSTVKPEYFQALQEEWSISINLKQFIEDMHLFRNEKIYFANYQRLERKHLRQKTTCNIGILPPDDYQYLNNSDKLKLFNKLPLHRAGKLEYVITTANRVTAIGFHELDMPQLCGPSGTTARRLALANQANLDKEEKRLFAFAVSLYNVSIGAHTIDECFIIANNTEFNQYIRGDYSSIFPETIKTDPAFHDFWAAIQELNSQHLDIYCQNQTAIRHLYKL